MCLRFHSFTLENLELVPWNDANPRLGTFALGYRCKVSIDNLEAINPMQLSLLKLWLRYLASLLSNP